MLRWYETLQDLHQKCVGLDGELDSSPLLMDSATFKKRQTSISIRSRSGSIPASRNGHSSKFDSRLEISVPLTPSGSGSDDGQEDGLRSLPMSRNGSGSNSGQGFDAHFQIPRKPAPGRFALPPHVRSGSLGMQSDYQGSYFSPTVETPPVPSIGPHSSEQFPFPLQDVPMARTTSKDSYTNGIPTPPLTAKLPADRQSRPSITPLNTRSRSASASNIHQIQTNVGRGRELPPPLPVGRLERDSDSPVTPHSPVSPISSRPTTGTSTFTSAFSSIPETPSSISSTSTSATRRPVPSTPGSSTTSLDRSSALKVKITYGNDMFVIVVPSDVTYATLLHKVRHKLMVCSNIAKDGPLRMKYPDEDGDLVTISSDEDVALAVETRTQHITSGSSGIGGAGVINLLVY